jgi:hypothetical protein
MFVFRATNINGHSELSTDLEIPIGDVPSKPEPVELVEHTETSITVEWPRVADG